eukprot:scaffold7843_cov61-Phaeocystis_antarctica.AAC.2
MSREAVGNAPGANISAVTPPPPFATIFGLTEIFCNRGVVNKGKGGCYRISRRVLGRSPAISPVCAAAALQTISAIRLLPPQVCTYGFRCKVQTRVLYAPRLQFVATLVPALVLLVVRRQRGGLPHQKVGKSGVDDREEVGK